MRSKAFTSKQLASKVAKFASDKKAQDIVILDMRGIVNFCDFFVIATGTSDRAVKAVAEGIGDSLSELGLNAHAERSVKNLHASDSNEGVGAWVLLDLGDVIVHVFEPTAREFYGLEHLWQDAPVVAYKERKKKA
ncbi:MAG: ribosome silencing factor [Candidatus Omnitrophica bacterium]|nr:ribosome silencing factor [Candidatus Omnitrophota bacterium]